MKKINTKILSILLFVAFAIPAYAQVEEAQDEEVLKEVVKEKEDLKKEDNTGTNPINFTYDFRLIQEMQQFKDDGGSMNKSYFEFRAPFGRDLANVTGQEAGALIDLGSRFAVRLRGYYNTVSLNDNSTSGSTTYSGIGDFDARFLAVAYSTSKFAIAPGVEGFFNTASNDAVGAGQNILAPVVFFGWFNLLGKYSIFAPGYQHRFNLDGKNVNQSVLEIYYVKILSKGKNWFILNPQPIFDWENDIQYMMLDVEWGFMIAKASGIAGAVRPGFGVGADAPLSYNFEFQPKFVSR
jgi:hypothetical protein